MTKTESNFEGSFKTMAVGLLQEVFALKGSLAEERRAYQWQQLQVF